MVSTPTNSSAPAPPRSTPNGWQPAAKRLPPDRHQRRRRPQRHLSQPFDRQRRDQRRQGRVRQQRWRRQRSLAAHPGQRRPAGDAGQCHTRWASDRRCRRGAFGHLPQPEPQRHRRPLPQRQGADELSALVALTCGPASIPMETTTSAPSSRPRSVRSRSAQPRRPWDTRRWPRSKTAATTLRLGPMRCRPPPVVAPTRPWARSRFRPTSAATPTRRSE